jgi:predicted RNase H-like HicB family nuclease
MLKLFYPACIYEDTETKGYRLKMPDVPELEINAETLADAMLNGLDKASSIILDRLENGEPAPKPSPLESVSLEKDGFVSLLMLDLRAYAEKTNRIPARRNVALPKWLDIFAKSQSIDISVLLEEALTSLYEKQALFQETFEAPPQLRLIQSS